MATATKSVPSGIAHVFGVTCTSHDCGFHESLHTSDPAEAVRTARELGWRLNGDQSLCPLCVQATQATNGRKPARKARKAVAK